MDDKSIGTMIKINYSNYSIWKILIEDLLCCKDLFESIELKGIRLATKNEAEWKMIDRKVVGIIRHSVEMTVINHIAHEKSAYLIWEKLEDTYEHKNA